MRQVDSIKLLLSIQQWSQQWIHGYMYMDNIPKPLLIKMCILFLPSLEDFS